MLLLFLWVKLYRLLFKDSFFATGKLVLAKIQSESKPKSEKHTNLDVPDPEHLG